MRRIARTRVPLLSLTLASLATAALSHRLIELLDLIGYEGRSFSRHAHGAFVPSVLGATMLLVVIVLRAALAAAQTRHTCKPYFDAISPLAAGAATIAGGLMILFLMESLEQSLTFGHASGIADALGGNVAIGTLLVAAVGSIVGVLGLRCVRALLAQTTHFARAIVAWIFAVRDTADGRSRTIDRRHDRAYVSTAILIACGLGLRAPPRLA